MERGDGEIMTVKKSGTFLDKRWKRDNERDRENLKVKTRQSDMKKNVCVARREERAMEARIVRRK